MSADPQLVTVAYLKWDIVYVLAPLIILNIAFDFAKWSILLRSHATQTRKMAHLKFDMRLRLYKSQ